MKGHGSKFGRKKEAAIAALLTHPSVEHAARAAGIGVTTLLRWMQMPEFDAEYQKACRAGFSQAKARLQQNSGAAVSTILKIMVDTSAPASCRLRAAGRVLDHADNGIEIASRPQTVPKEFGKMTMQTTDDLMCVSDMVAEKLGAGDITLDDARDLYALIEQRRKLIETHGFERRLQKLEEGRLKPDEPLDRAA